MLYSSSRPADKLKSLEHRFNNPLSSFATAKQSLHRPRRAALNPFFSKRKIAAHGPIIQRHMDKVCQRLTKEYKGTDQVLAMNDMWGCFTSDIIAEYCFERPYDFIDQPDFRSSFTTAMIDLVNPVHFITQFPWAIGMISCLPDSVVTYMEPAMASVINFNEVN